MEVQRLYVGGLYPGITETELKERFSKFGEIDNVQIKVKKGFEECSVKAFAHLDIKAQESDIKKCIKTFDKTKWKGYELKIERAKENFLSRLMKERNTPKEKRERTPEEEKKSSPFEKEVKGPPGTKVPGEENWVVGKYGRILPVVNLKKEGSSFAKKIDPSKYVHKVKRLEKDDDTNDNIDIKSDHLTWHLDDNENEITKKRKGEFKEWKPKAKQRKSDLNYSMEDVLKKSDAKYMFDEKNQDDSGDVEFEIVDPDSHDMPQQSRFERTNVNLSKFDSDSDSDSGIGGNTYQRELKNIRRISEPMDVNKKTFSGQLSDRQGSTRRSLGTLKGFKGTRMLSKSVDIKYVDSEVAKSMANISDKPVNKIVEKSVNSEDLYPNKTANLKNVKSIKMPLSPQKRVVNMGSFNNLNEFSSGFSSDLILNKSNYVNSDSDEDYKLEKEEQDLEFKSVNDKYLDIMRTKMLTGKSPEPQRKDHMARVDSESYIENTPSSEHSLESTNSKLAKPGTRKKRKSSDSTDSSDSDDDSGDNTDRTNRSNKSPKTQMSKNLVTKSASDKDVFRSTGNISHEDDAEKDESDDGSEDAMSSEEDDESDGSRDDDGRTDSSSKLKSKHDIASSESDSSSSSDEDVVPNRSPMPVLLNEDRNIVIPHGNALKSAKTEKVKSAVHEMEQGSTKTNARHGTELDKMQKNEEVERHRLEAVKQKHQESMKQIATVQKALANINKGTALNTKIVFDDDSDDGRDSPVLKRVEPKKETQFDSSDDESGDDDADDDVKEGAKVDAKNDEATGTGKKPALFDSSSSGDEDSDSSDDNDENRFAVKPQFEGSSGSKLLELQTTYGNDKRFQLDERFVESDSDEEMDEGDMKDGDDEKRNAMKILEQVVGFKVNKDKRKKDEKSKSTFKDVTSLHYDPTRVEHKDLELAKEQVSKKSTDKEKRLKEIAAVTAKYSGDLRMERFVEVSDSFKDTFGDKSNEDENQTFSLLKAFGTQGPNEEEEKEENVTSNNESEMKLGERFVEQNEEVDVDKEEESMETREADLDARDSAPVAQDTDKKMRKKKIKTHAPFFFRDDDDRLKTGLKFYRTEDLETIRERWKKEKQNYIQQYKVKAKNFQRKLKKQPGKRGGNNSQKAGQKSKPFNKKFR